MPTLNKSDSPYLGPLLTTKPTILWIHDPSSSFSQDAVINPEAFPTINDGQLLRLHFLNNNNNNNNNTTVELEPLIVKATYADRESIGRLHHLQISISKDIAERLKLRFRPEIYIELIEPHTPYVTLDHVELGFKEQYLGRSDMWRLQQSLAGTCAYLEKKILFAGAIKTTVKKMWSGDKEVTSGYISDTTRMIFRSGSAKYFVFIQMSREMWEFDEDGELYYEKVVNNFLPQLFNRWNEEGTNHVVSIVLFSRVFYDSIDGFKNDESICQKDDGRYYKDFYKVLADWETTDDWTSIIGPLKEEQLHFQQSILTRIDDGIVSVNGQIAMAFEGNILEAVNLALNPFDRHYVDRDLMRTGLSIILVTPGAGKFTVDKKLLRLTNERMSDNGIAMDLVCLSPLPLHITPLLRYKSGPPPQHEEMHDNTINNPIAPNRYSKQTMNNNSPDWKNNFGPSTTMITPNYQDPFYYDDVPGVPTNWYFSVPHWIDCSFYHHETGKFLKQDKFMARCKMYEIQMMGIMESDIASVHIPFLSNKEYQHYLLQQYHHHHHPSASSVLLGNKSLRSQKSSSSLNDKSSLKTDDGVVTLGPHHNSLGNGESYLSRSANFAITRRSSYYTPTSSDQTQSIKNNNNNKVDEYDSDADQSQNGNNNNFINNSTIDTDQYDNFIFKDNLEPRFNKRVIVTTQSSKPSSSSGGGNIKSALSKNSLDSNDNSSRAVNIKQSTMTWHHNDQRRITSIMSQSQQLNNKITFDDHVRKDDNSTTKISDLFRSSPTHPRYGIGNSSSGGGNGSGGTTGIGTNDDSRYRVSRRNTMNSNEMKLVTQAAVNTNNNTNNNNDYNQNTTTMNNNNCSGGDDDESVLISSSTVDPMPIYNNNNKGGFGNNRTTDGRKSSNHSPQQNAGMSSLPSIHKQSNNSDGIRTSFGAGGTGGAGGAGGAQGGNRSSPSHNWSSRALTKYTIINPCNPADQSLLFTSHLRRWQHALPRQAAYDGPVVYWKSLVTPACLPLTTDYFPSNEELKQLYTHYMYTVSASEDVNLYQAGDRNLSELKKTEILLTEMISQRLAQGFQIIVDITGSSYYQKAMTTAAPVAGKVMNPVSMSGDHSSSNNSHHSGITSGINNMNNNNNKNMKTASGISYAFSKAGVTHKQHSAFMSHNNKTSNIHKKQPSIIHTTNINNINNVNKGTIINTTTTTPSSTISSSMVNSTFGQHNNNSNSAFNGTNVGGINNQDENDKMKWKHMVWWLSMGHQVHQLTFDSSGQNVEVRRYVRASTFKNEEGVSYKCVIWPKNVAGYRDKIVNFKFPNPHYSWNYLDHLVAGYQEELTDNLRFWRARFIVIPREQLPSNVMHIGGSNNQENLNEEEKRLALFDTWIQNFRKAKWLSPSEREEMQRRKKKEIGTDLGIKVTTMDPSAYLSIEVSKSAQQQYQQQYQHQQQQQQQQLQQQQQQHGNNNNNNNSNGNGGGSTLFSSIGSLGGSTTITKDSKSKDIVAAMRDPKTGIKLMDRRWHFKVFRGAFIGSQCVEWFIEHIDDINSREEAVAFGNSLMKRNPPLFVSSTNRHGFLDGHYFYQFHEEFVPSSLRSWFLTTTSSRKHHQKSVSSSSLSSSQQNNSNKKDEHVNDSNSTTTTTTSINNNNSNATTPTITRLDSSSSSDGRTHQHSNNYNKPTIEFDMAQSMIIDVDPYKKSDRRETAILYYDTIHNPNNCYHFQLNWLGCTAQLVQELLRTWSLQADRCGLKVVEGSMEQAYDDSENNNPFQCPVPIPLIIPPPPVSELNMNDDIPEQFYEIALVRHLGFVLDVEADTHFEHAKKNDGVEVKYPYLKCPYKYDQYIHRTGVAFIQIRPHGKGFYWVNNRLYTNHTPQLINRRRDPSASQLQHPDYLRRKFQEACSDANWLTSFWQSTRSYLLKINGDEVYIDDDDDNNATMLYHHGINYHINNSNHNNNHTQQDDSSLITTENNNNDKRYSLDGYSQQQQINNKLINNNNKHPGGVGRWVFENARAIDVQLDQQQKDTNLSPTSTLFGSKSSTHEQATDNEQSS